MSAQRVEPFLFGLLEAVEDAVALLGPDWRVLYVNRAQKELLRTIAGHDVPDIIGKTIDELGLGERTERVKHDLRTAMEIEGTVTAERAFQTREGEIWREVKMTAIRASNGTVQGIAIVNRDSQARKMAEDRLQLLAKVSTLAQSLEYDRVLGQIADLAIPELADWAAVDVFEGEAFRRVKIAHRDPAKADLAAALGRFEPGWRRHDPTWASLLGGKPVFIERVEDCTRDRYAGSEEQREVFRRLGVESAIVAPLVVAGKTVALISFFTTSESHRRYTPSDVTLAEELMRRVATIAENARLHEELRTSERRFRAALQNTGVFLGEKGPGQEPSWTFNSPFTSKDDSVLPPEEKAKLQAAEERVVATGEPTRLEFNANIDGEPRHYLFDMHPLPDASGAIVGIMGAGTDVTELKKVQAELGRALAFRDKIMGVLSHDLRNPLGAIDSLATLSMRKDDLPEPLRKRLEQMSEAARRSLALIGTLLDFSESRFSGSLRIQPVRAKLGPIATRVVEELTAGNPSRSIALDVLRDGTVEVDPVRLAQVLSNVIGNALIHGDVESPVRIALAVSEADAVISVNNRGPVIPSDQVESLFQPFRRGPTRDSSARGLGLGLYIVRHIVSAHGGTVTVHSNAAEGTTFHIHLPCRQPPSPLGEAQGGSR